MTSVPFSKLTASERRSGVEALGVVVNEVAEKTGRPRRDLDVMATVVASIVALAADGGWLLGVEFPAHVKRDTMPRTRPSGNFAFASVDAEAEWTREETRWLPLGEGFELLAGAASPEVELANRRAELADKRRAAAETEAERERQQEERQARQAVWAAKNAARIEAWDKLPREHQLIHVVADRYPELAPALLLLIELAGQSKALAVSLPDSFRVDLRRQ